MIRKPLRCATHPARAVDRQPGFALAHGGAFTRMLERTRGDPDKFADYASRLFGAMAAGGDVGFEAVAWFNGGLFDDDKALPRPTVESAPAIAPEDP